MVWVFWYECSRCRCDMNNPVQQTVQNIFPVLLMSIDFQFLQPNYACFYSCSSDYFPLACSRCFLHGFSYHCYADDPHYRLMTLHGWRNTTKLYVSRTNFNITINLLSFSFSKVARNLGVTWWAPIFHRLCCFSRSLLPLCAVQHQANLVILKAVSCLTLGTSCGHL